MSEIQAENTSGRGPDAVLPSELRGWNWGAFFLNWVWGLGNQTSPGGTRRSDRAGLGGEREYQYSKSKRDC